jgi:aspartyl/asparaginyl-tRNA synthetase
MNKLINPLKFNQCVNRMREFFLKKNFVEVHTQNALSILAACEDPSTISTYQYAGKVWPLPQTGQMWLEEVLLDNPDLPGVFCVSTSYRNEPNPVPGRHDLIFPMFEFESKGNMNDLQTLEVELLDHLGFDKTNGIYPEGDYLDVAKKYKTPEVEHEHEMKLKEDYGPVYFLKNFPFYTSPFWNMKADFTTNNSNKIDVILHGVETIGSAERSTDKDEMKEMFYTISDGEYKDILYTNFSKERVDAELNKFLEYDFFPRYGGGIGVTRMISAMEQSNLLDTELNKDTTTFKNIYTGC